MGNNIDGIIGFGILAMIIGFAVLNNGWLGVRKEKSKSVLWFNATHAVLSAINNKNVFVYGGLAHTKKAQENERILLDEWWDIKSYEDLNDTLDWLEKEGHRRGEIEDIGAWDYSRAMQLLSSCYLAGYISRDEALERSLKIALFIQKEFNSWDEFMNSYIEGYKLWSNSNDTQREMIYKRLKSARNSIYSVPWNLKLKKDW
ncbi:MAG: DUF1266 domain-containing protein [Campylobacter sp.]|nr:DUF1266 domain-containing protein [Campylobacter sp.]